jgi:endonuclease/exonuclease/phosphatase (EEP) superfamily protein YafD
MPRPPGARLRRSAGPVALDALAGALVLAGAVRASRPERVTGDIALTAASPWLLAPSGLVALGAVVARRWRPALLAGTVAAAHAWWVRPGPAGRPESPTPTDPQAGRVSVAFANVWCRNPSIDAELIELASNDADLVGLAEITDRHLAAIERHLPPDRYPFRLLHPDRPKGSRGLALLSRYPLEDAEEWTSCRHPQLDATVVGPVRFRFHLIHTWAPRGRGNIAAWRRQLGEIRDRVATDTLPSVMAGDFNATRQHRSFARLLAPGWTDAGSRAFGGWRGTWPADRWHPPLFRIDHILAGPGVAVAASRSGRGPGSDHRPIHATLCFGR